MSSESSSKKQMISFLGIIGIGLTTVIGSGIWKDPLSWVDSSGIMSLVAIIVGWLLMFTVGLSYAECVAMFPNSGGPYSYVGGAINKTWGSIVGIVYYVGYLFIGTVLAILTTNFTFNAIGYEASLWQKVLLTLGYIIVLGILASVIHLRDLGTVSILWVGLKIILLLVVAVLAIINGSSANYSVSNLTFSGFQNTLISSLWALTGFEVMLIFAAEVTKEDGKIPGNKKMPISILVALGVILVTYLVVAFGASSILGIGGLGNQSAFDFIANATGISSNIIALFAAISAGGTTFAICAVLAHQLKVMADGGSLPTVFKLEKGNIRVFNISVSIIIVMVLAVLAIYLDIIGLFAVIGLGAVLLSAMLPAGLIALYLRIKMPILERPFKAPLFFVVFPLAILLSVYLLVLNFMSLL